MAREESD